MSVVYEIIHVYAVFHRETGDLISLYNDLELAYKDSNNLKYPVMICGYPVFCKKSNE